MPDKEVVAML
jgi:hypothetical protein